MRIIDKNTEYYDYLQNSDDPIVFDRRGSYIVTKGRFGASLYKHMDIRRCQKFPKEGFLLLQCGATYWLLLVTVSGAYSGKIDKYYIGDAMKLKQVLINILGNAVKFTPEGGTVSLVIEEKARFDKKAVVEFVISDTGIGMSKDFLPHIFEPFSQEESAPTGKYGSTGLGMSITKSIMLP